MDLSSAHQVATALMADHGLTQRGWSFAFNRRKSSLGLCNYDTKRIELSAFFVAANDDDAVGDTVRHEMAHALAGHEAGHGPAWVTVCQRIGATPRRTCATAVMPPGPFRSRCRGCGREHDRHRRPMKTRTYYCRACGPQEGKLRFVLNPTAAVRRLPVMSARIAIRIHISPPR